MSKYRTDDTNFFSMVRRITIMNGMRDTNTILIKLLRCIQAVSCRGEIKDHSFFTSYQLKKMHYML